MEVTKRCRVSKADSARSHAAVAVLREQRVAALVADGGGVSMRLGPGVAHQVVRPFE